MEQKKKISWSRVIEKCKQKNINMISIVSIFKTKLDVDVNILQVLLFECRTKKKNLTFFLKLSPEFLLEINDNIKKTDVVITKQKRSSQMKRLNQLKSGIIQGDICLITNKEIITSEDYDLYIVDEDYYVESQTHSEKNNFIEQRNYEVSQNLGFEIGNETFSKKKTYDNPKIVFSGFESDAKIKSILNNETSDEVKNVKLEHSSETMFNLYRETNSANGIPVPVLDLESIINIKNLEEIIEKNTDILKQNLYQENLQQIKSVEELFEKFKKEFFEFQESYKDNIHILNSQISALNNIHSKLTTAIDVRYDDNGRVDTSKILEKLGDKEKIQKEKQINNSYIIKFSNDLMKHHNYANEYTSNCIFLFTGISK